MPAASVFFKIAISAGLVALGYLSLRFFNSVISISVNRVTGKVYAPNTMKTFSSLAVVFVVLALILRVWNVNITPYLTGLGIGSLVVGLALQEPLSNLFAGIMVIATGKVKEGEIIEVGEFSGLVEAVHTNHTIVRTLDGKRVLIPNRAVWAQSVVHPWDIGMRRVTLTVGVSYNSNLRKVLEILEKAMEEEPLVEKGPFLERDAISRSPLFGNLVMFKGFGDSAIEFELRFWVRRENFYLARRALAIRIKEMFDRHGIEIPFNQVDVHIK